VLSTVTSKGQITIPVDIRRAAGLDVGTQVEFIINGRQRIELVPRHGDIRGLRGAVPVPASAVSVDAMRGAVSAGWTEEAPASPTTDNAARAVKQAPQPRPRKSRP
jgi:antitoxin PrlF